MRISYSDDEDFPGQFELWQANCRRSLAGRRGQTALRELEAALLALPEKKLIAHDLVNAQGEVCAIGALAKYKNKIDARLARIGEHDATAVGVELGMPALVAWKIVELSDVELDTHYDYDVTRQPRFVPVPKLVPYTPEERYEKVLAWTRRQIKPTSQKEIAI